jgi:adenosylhomocysteine nucleosidase
VSDAPVAVVFALHREAGPFLRRKPGVPYAVCGVGREDARLAADVLIAAMRPRLIISAGFCGALVPSLRVGDIVTSPRLVTVDHLVADPAEKRRLAELHHADAVDMESAAIAEVCAERGVAFLAVRAVSDTVDTALSPELVRLLSGGRVSAWKAIRALVGKPSLLGEFRRLARDTRIAANKLAEALSAIITRQSPPVATGGL